MSRRRVWGAESLASILIIVLVLGSRPEARVCGGQGRGSFCMSSPGASGHGLRSWELALMGSPLCLFPLAQCLSEPGPRLQAPPWQPSATPTPPPHTHTQTPL